MFFLAADAGEKLDVGAKAMGHVKDLRILHPEGGMPLLTMHMVTMLVVLAILVWAMLGVAKRIQTGTESGTDKYLTKGRFAQLIEVIVLYLRDNVVRPQLGEAGTKKYLPFLLSLFFFILFCNVFGLIPLLDVQHLIGATWGDTHFAVLGGTATGNIAVTLALATIAFFVIQIHALRELGIGGWAHHLLGGAPWYIAPVMVPIELAGMFIKPAALAIRLFANMLAGHVLMAMLALFGLMAIKGMDSLAAGVGVSAVAIPFAVAITFLEIFVAFLQAFIFMFLTTLFIAQMSHHDHEHDHDDEHAHDAHGAAAHA